MPPQRLWRAWKKGGWIRRLSGMTSEPSTLDLGVVLWIASLRATPASPSPSPECALASPTLGTFGRTSRASSASAHLPSSPSRTCLVMSPSGSTWSSTTLKRWATSVRAFCSELRTSGRLTAVSGSLSWPRVWPTACTADSRSSAKATTTTGPERSHPGTMLTDAIRQWATSVASPQANRTTRPIPDERHGAHLSAQAVQWPSPTASMATPADMVQAMYAGSDPRRPSYAEASALFPTPTAARYGSSQNGINGKGGEFERPSANTPSLFTLASRGSLPSRETPMDGEPTSKRGLVLNPRFVEALMGLPSGWTDCERSEMLSSLSRPAPPFGFLPEPFETSGRSG